MAFDDVIVDRTPMWAALGSRFNVNVRHGFLSAQKKPGGRNWAKSRPPIVLAAKLLPDYAAFLGAVPVVGGAPVLISIVLVDFIALAGFLIVRCSTPLSK